MQILEAEGSKGHKISDHLISLIVRRCIDMSTFLCFIKLSLCLQSFPRRRTGKLKIYASLNLALVLVVRLRVKGHFTPRKNSPQQAYLLHKGLGEPQSRSGYGGERKIF
jgi:hypothetical protein